MVNAGNFAVPEFSRESSLGTSTATYVALLIREMTGVAIHLNERFFDQGLFSSSCTERSSVPEPSVALAGDGRGRR